jgi:uncharacterized repeat protein (TIGR02543 family)
MQMKTRILSGLLSCALVLTMTPMAVMAAEGSYSDTDGHWAESAIDRFSGYEVIEGYNGEFYPNNDLTRGQMATIITKLMKLPAAESAGFADVADDDWYADAINRCAAAGIMKGGDNNKANPNDSISRQDTMVMMGRALGIEEEADPDLSDFADGEQVADYAKGYVAALTKAGIVNGIGDGQVAGGDDINRASAMTILDRAISAYANEDGATVTGTGTGIVLVVADNVTITGDVQDVVVAQGSDGGSVTLENATVTGTVTVKADAEVNLAGKTEASSVTVSEGAKATVTVDAGAKVETVTLSGEESALNVSGSIGTVNVTETATSATVTTKSGATIDTVTLSSEESTLNVSGAVGSVNVTETATSATVTTESGATINTVTLSSEESTLNVGGTVGTVNVTETATSATVTTESGSTITTVNSEADSVTVTGSGTVTTANVTGENTVVDTAGTTVNEGIEAGGSFEGAGGGDDTSGGDTSGGDTSGGGSSSGGSTGGTNITYRTVTFNSNGGSDVASKSVRNGGTVTAPTEPTKTNYDFKGWYSDAALTQAYAFTTSVTSNITLYAKWCVSKSTIDSIISDGISSVNSKIGSYATLGTLSGTSVSVTIKNGDTQVTQVFGDIVGTLVAALNAHTDVVAGISSLTAGSVTTDSVEEFVQNLGLTGETKLSELAGKNWSFTVTTTCCDDTEYTYSVNFV